MQWIILIGNEELNLNKIKSIEHFDSINSYDVHENRYCVDYGQDHVFYDYVADLDNDYEQDELSKVPFLKPRFIMMIYTSEERMRKILKQNNFLSDIYVDNDYGLIIPIKEFVRLGMPIELK